MKQRLRVLLVEDNPREAGLIREMLVEGDQAAFGLERVATLSRGLERLDGDDFDLLLLDLSLPDSEGFETFARMHKRAPQTPIIVLTGLDDEDLAIKAVREGAQDYLVKDEVSGDLLARAMRYASERKRAEEALRQSEERFHSLFETMVEGVALHEVVCDEGGDPVDYVILDVNPAYELHTGIRPEDAIGSRACQLYEAGEPPYLDIYAQVAATGEPTQFETHFEPMDRYFRISVFSPNEGQFATVFEDISERKRAEVILQRQNQELTTLNEIAQTVNSTLDLQETLTFIAERSIQLLGVEATSVLLCDEEEDDLWFAAASGAGADVIHEQRLAVGQGVAGWVAQNGEPALVPDISRDPRWFGGFDETSDFVTRSLLCVPLRSKGRTIGVLEAINKKSDSLGQEDLRLLSLLAEPAATAIENARLFERVRTSREQLRALSRRLVDVQETERGRVARELHDEIGQALSSLLLSLSVMEGAVDEPLAMITHINQLEGLIDRTLENLDRLAMDLRPASLDHLGLAPALEHYVEALGERSVITTRFESVGLEGERLPSTVEAALYRIVQEALTNMLRHSQATCVDVLLERRGDQVVTLVEDDGVGFDPDAVLQQSTHLGLFGMQERAEMVGGSLTIESRTGGGTTILVEVPYVQPSEE